MENLKVASVNHVSCTAYPTNDSSICVLFLLHKQNVMKGLFPPRGTKQDTHVKNLVLCS